MRGPGMETGKEKFEIGKTGAHHMQETVSRKLRF